MVLPIALWHAAYLETERCHATNSSLLSLTAICTKPAFLRARGRPFPRIDGVLFECLGLKIISCAPALDPSLFQLGFLVAFLIALAFEGDIHKETCVILLVSYRIL